MALIIRIDVDRPYGKNPFLRHALSKLSSGVYFPRIPKFGYLRELEVILQTLNQRKARAYVFFRRCTLPSESILELIRKGQHEVGLHLEDSRTFESFVKEKKLLEEHIGERVIAVSKHGSGTEKYGLRHYAPYEPDKYVEWARRTRMKLFLGNLEDPSIGPSTDETDFHVYPSAFWLEPAWRKTDVFTIEWLLSQASLADVVLLIHPENVLSSPVLITNLERLLTHHETKIL